MSPEDKKQKIKRLAELHSESKKNAREKRDILMSMSDPEKSKKIYESIKELHLMLLKFEGEFGNRMSEILESIVEDEQLLELLSSNINKPFYRSKDVFDFHEKNEIQRRLVKNGDLLRQEFDRHRTAGHHVKTVIKAKNIDNLRKRMEQLEYTVCIHQKFIECIQKGVIPLDESMGNRMLSLKGTASDSTVFIKKINLYQMKVLNPSMSYKQLADSFAISKTCAYKWYKEIEGLVV
jgi:hypothetical protein